MGGVAASIRPGSLRVGANGGQVRHDPIVLRMSELYGEPAGAPGMVSGGEAREMQRAVREAMAQGRIRKNEGAAELKKLRLIEQLALEHGVVEAWTSTSPAKLIERGGSKAKRKRKAEKAARKKNRRR